jgi:hypothetical protein
MTSPVSDTLWFSKYTAAHEWWANTGTPAATAPIQKASQIRLIGRF